MTDNIFVVTKDYFNCLLEKNDIEYDCQPWYHGYRWTFSDFPSGDIICCHGSYGGQDGMLESYGFDWDKDDVTCASPVEMIARLKGTTVPSYNGDLTDVLNSLDELLNS